MTEPTLEDLVNGISDEHPAAPLDAVSAAVATARRLDAVGDALVDHFVAEARREGRSWAQIATSLGVTRQAAHRRYESGPGPQDAPMGTDGIREKPAPFCGTRMREDGAIEVQLETGGAWYELRRLDGHPIEKLVYEARLAYRGKWLKRLGEDLDCVYGLVGDTLGSHVVAILADAAGRESERTVESTVAKRKAAWRLNVR